MANKANWEWHVEARTPVRIRPKRIGEASMMPMRIHHRGVRAVPAENTIVHALLTERMRLTEKIQMISRRKCELETRYEYLLRMLEAHVLHHSGLSLFDVRQKPPASVQPVQPAGAQQAEEVKKESGAADALSAETVVKAEPMEETPRDAVTI